MSTPQDTQKLIATKQRRLQKLKEQEAAAALALWPLPDLGALPAHRKHRSALHQA